MKKSFTIKFPVTFGLFCFLILLLESAVAATPKDFGIEFIENKGQIVDQNYHPNSNVKYLLCRSGANVQLRKTGFSYDTYAEQEETTTGNPTNQAIPVAGNLSVSGLSRHYHRVDVELLNCNPAAEMIGEGRSDSYFNYFTAGTPQGGITDVHSYQKIVYKNIYPFIDLEFFCTENGKSSSKEPAEYQFVLHAGAKISDIQLSYSGMNELKLENGQLNILVSAGRFAEKIPSSYLSASRKKIDVKYISSGNNVYTFAMTHPFTITTDLIIDPVPCFTWGSYYGGSSWEAGSGIALDSSNNVYIAGSTQSSNYIATSGAHQATFAGGTLYDICVAKFNTTGTSLLWGTYYGGTGNDGENGIAIDTGGVYIAGYAHSNGLATAGSWQSNCPNCDNFNCDVIVAKFSLTGALLWGTYYGTSAYGQADDITVNASGVYITGETYASTGISTVGSWQPTYGGSLNAFVSKFNLSGSQLIWGTYYGNYNAFPWGIALDPIGNVYIAGYTDMATDTLKVTPGAYQTTSGGGNEAFVAKFNPTGSSLLYGTYYGGAGTDRIYDLAVDTGGNAYFTGFTSSTSGIATAGAWQTTNGTNNAFVAKLNPTGTSLLWGTYYGGSVNEECQSITLDALNNVYICGGTESSNGIATAGAYKTSFSGGSDAFIAKFDPTGSSLLWATYYGGTGYENTGATYLRYGGIVLNSANDVYITGITTSYNGMTSAGTWKTTSSGPADAFVAKFSCNSLPPVADLTADDTSICANSCANFIDKSTGATSWHWSFQGANPSSSTDQNPQNICYQAAGTFDVTLSVSNSGGSDSINIVKYMHISAAPIAPTIKQVDTLLYFNTDTSYTSYQWLDSATIIPGATDTFLVINHSGNYNVQVTSSNGCKIAVGINVLIGIDVLQKDQIHIFPNPATDQLMITGLTSIRKDEMLDLYNMLGEKINSYRIENKNITIDVSKLSQGVYYLSESGAVMKFIKE